MTDRQKEFLQPPITFYNGVISVEGVKKVVSREFFTCEGKIYTCFELNDDKDAKLVREEQLQHQP
jgi:hypothetical protein